MTTTIWLQQLTPNGVGLAGGALPMIHNDQVRAHGAFSCVSSRYRLAPGRKKFLVTCSLPAHFFVQTAKCHAL